MTNREIIDKLAKLSDDNELAKNKDILYHIILTGSGPEMVDAFDLLSKWYDKENEAFFLKLTYNDEFRADACEALRCGRTVETIERLWDLMVSDKDPWVRMYCVFSYFEVYINIHNKIDKGLISNLQDHLEQEQDGLVKQAYYSMLYESGEKRYLADMINIMEDASYDHLFMLRLVHSLYHIMDEENVNIIKKAIKHYENYMHTSGIPYQRIKKMERDPVLFNLHYLDILLEEKHLLRKSKLLRLKNLSQNEDWEIRDKVAEALGILVADDDDLAEEILLTLMEDEQKYVRESACEAIFWSVKPEIYEKVRYKAQTDSSHFVRSVAVISAYDIYKGIWGNTPELISHLEEGFMNEKHPYVQLAYYEAFHYAQAPFSVRQIFPYLENSEEAIRYRAIVALENTLTESTAEIVKEKVLTLYEEETDDNKKEIDELLHMIEDTKKRCSN